MAKCYEYRVCLENGIKARVTPAHHAAIYSFTFPQGKAGALLVDVARKLDVDACMKTGYVTIAPQEYLRAHFSAKRIMKMRRSRVK